MKKKWIKFALLALSLVLMLPMGGAHAAGAPMNTKIRIGLTYDTNAVPGANLLNEVGSGYRFGYFDNDLNFWQVGYTTETAISVVKTQNVWYGPLEGTTRSGYTDIVPTNIAVGCYHIQLPNVYTTFEEAQAAAQQFSGAFPAWLNGSYTVRIGAYPSADEANAALAILGMEGALLAGTSSGAVSVVKTGTSTVLFQFDGGTGTSFGVRPGLEDTIRTETWYANNRYFGDFRYERINGGNLTVVNVLDLEDYINCVISQEMSDSWPVEALKAQAICARSYAATCIGRHTSDHFDLCATTHCQAYPGCSRIGSGTTQAALETKGEYLWYNGAIAETYYFSSDGGATEDVRNVWGSNSNLPYLKGVEDPWEATVEDKISGYHWSVTMTKTELEEKLRASGRSCGTLADVRVAERTPTGNVKSLTFTDISGSSWTISGGDKCRIFLGLKSLRYMISGGNGNGTGTNAALPSIAGAYAVDGSGNMNKISDAPYVITGSGVEKLGSAPEGDSFTFTGTGWGHNVGMSQWGAYAMAQAGKNYRDILTFYYTGVEIR